MKRPVRVILILLTAAFVAAQINPPASRPAPRISENKIMERQLVYAEALAKRGDSNYAYQAYSKLVNIYPDEIRVISGLVDNGIKSGKIKECESVLKNLAARYPISAKYADPVKEKDIFPVKLAGYISELYFRTGRQAQGEEVMKMISGAATSRRFISELEAEIYYRSGYMDKSEKKYLDLRKEQNDRSAYSEELFRIYISAGRIGKASGEIVKAALSKNDKSAPGVGFDAKAELFRLYGTDGFRDSIIIFAKKMFLEKAEGAGFLLSELYFSSGDYTASFETLKKAQGSGTDGHLTRNFAVRLFKEKNYGMASEFFELYQSSKEAKWDEGLYGMYILSLTESGEYKKTEKVIRESGLEDSELMLAEIYHNRTDRPKESESLYEKNLEYKREHSRYWLDYAVLELSLGQTEKALDIISKVFEKNVAGVFFPDRFTEFKYIEAAANLLNGDTEKFKEISGILTGDNFISDKDNDLIKMNGDLDLIGNDEKLLKSYLTLVRKQTDRTSDTEEPDFHLSFETDPEKKKFLYDLSFRYLELAGDEEKLKELCSSMIADGYTDNSAARMIARFSKKVRKDQKMREILMVLLKSGINEEIKAEIRDIIRENEPS